MQLDNKIAWTARLQKIRSQRLLTLFNMHTRYSVLDYEFHDTIYKYVVKGFCHPSLMVIMIISLSRESVMIALNLCQSIFFRKGFSVEG